VRHVSKHHHFSEVLQPSAGSRVPDPAGDPPARNGPGAWRVGWPGTVKNVTSAQCPTPMAWMHISYFSIPFHISHFIIAKGRCASQHSLNFQLWWVQPCVPFCTLNSSPSFHSRNHPPPFLPPFCPPNPALTCSIIDLFADASICGCPRRCVHLEGTLNGQ